MTEHGEASKKILSPKVGKDRSALLLVRKTVKCKERNVSA